MVYQKLIQKDKQVYIDTLESIGWFELPQNDKEKITERVNENKDANYCLFALTHVGFDGESFDEIDDYDSIIKEFLQYPSCNHLKAEVSGDHETLYIKINGKSEYFVEIDLEETFGWFNSEVLDFLNDEVFSNEGIEERWINLPPCDQCAEMIFVPTDLYDKAIEHGILPENEDYFFHLD